LKLARTEFVPRRAVRGSEWAGFRLAEVASATQAGRQNEF